jgi:hypothetical protein
MSSKREAPGKVFKADELLAVRSNLQDIDAADVIKDSRHCTEATDRRSGENGYGTCGVGKNVQADIYQSVLSCCCIRRYTG